MTDGCGVVASIFLIIIRILFRRWCGKEKLVELEGLEPSASSMPLKRSPR